MVRLAVLMLALGFVGCAQQPPQTPYSSVPEPIPELTRLDDGQHSSVVTSLLQQAEVARQQQRLQIAATTLDQARQIEPRNPEIFYRQAWLELQRDQASRAESFIRRGLVFALGDATLTRRLQWLLAQSLEQQGRLMEAMVIRAKLNEVH